MFRRIANSSRYRNEQTGEDISRRQYERRFRPAQLAKREAVYKERKAARREALGPLTPEDRGKLADDKRYWRQRFAEQYAHAHGIDDRKAYDIMGRPGSMFNRLWAASEGDNFNFRPGSAWDELTKYAHAVGGLGAENERARYLAIIAWYTRLGEAHTEAWMRRNNKGQWTYPNLSSRQKAEITRIGKGQWRNK